MHNFSKTLLNMQNSHRNNQQMLNRTARFTAKAKKRAFENYTQNHVCMQVVKKKEATLHT